MVANNKKHLKELESQAPDTSESNRAAQSQERTGRQTKQPRRTVVIDNSEDEEQQGLTGAKLQELSDKQELKLSKQLDKNGQKMIAYSCKICGTKIHRPTYDNSLTNLSKHIAAFLKKQQDVEGTEKLACVGVLGTGDINPREVLQLCVIWCAEGAQPFLALGQPAHRSILHPEVLKNLPNWRAVSAKISFLYSAVQETFIKSLALHALRACARLLARLKKAACSRCTPLWKGVQGLHANHHTLHAYNRRAYGVQACQTGVQSLHACQEGVQSLHALWTGMQALHTCGLTGTSYPYRRAHVSLSIREAYVSQPRSVPLELTRARVPKPATNHPDPRANHRPRPTATHQTHHQGA
ncbi:hypothetical protein PCASD_13708 [Puccinia coronata f. sp. avenae]|uniref:BED-type domain-containing protein n=1 Tax=Puccinia coronata f. sp. avenae TaxID=200324 RepID=A0A2N5UF93_9BASI|nr:hypothetical protein PCASD_13708 [Puccinia coronata f. sp. avenae]